MRTAIDVKLYFVGTVRAGNCPVSYSHDSVGGLNLEFASSGDRTDGLIAAALALLGDVYAATGDFAAAALVTDEAADVAESAGSTNLSASLRVRAATHRASHTSRGAEHQP